MTLLLILVGIPKSSTEGVQFSNGMAHYAFSINSVYSELLLSDWLASTWSVWSCFYFWFGLAIWCKVTLAAIFCNTSLQESEVNNLHLYEKVYRHSHLHCRLGEDIWSRCPQRSACYHRLTSPLSTWTWSKPFPSFPFYTPLHLDASSIEPSSPLPHLLVSLKKK